MDDDQEEFEEKLMSFIEESLARMTPIEREFCSIGRNDVMERAHNHFWIRYCLKEPGDLLLTKETLQEKGREDEIRILWLLDNAPFSFRKYGAERRSPTD